MPLMAQVGSVLFVYRIAAICFGYLYEYDDFVARWPDKGCQRVVQYLGGLLYGFEVGRCRQIVDSECHQPIKCLEAQVVVGILLEFGRWVNQVRGILAIVAVDIVVEGQLLSATCHGTVFGICLDTLYEAFDGFG